MELKNLSVDETTILGVNYPNGQEAGMRIHLCSMDSKVPKTVLRKWDKISSRSKRNVGLDFDQKEEASIELLAACIDSWEGYTDDGVDVPCNDDTKRDLLTNPATRFIRTQVDEAVGDVNNFLSISGSN